MYLISGGTGFVGLNAAKLLADRGKSVVITSAPRRNNPFADEVVAQSKGAIAMEVLDLNNPHEVHDLFSRYRFLGVLHTATNHMFAASRTAVLPSYNMLFNTMEAVSAWGVPRFVLASSAVVYRGITGLLQEDVPLPTDLSPYAPFPALPKGKGPPFFEVTLKRVMELVSLDYGLDMTIWDHAPKRGGTGPATELQTAVVRFPQQTGPYYTSMYNAFANLVHGLAGRLDRIPEDRTLRAWSDISYILDSVAGLTEVLLAPKLPHRIYNVSSGVRVTARQIGEAAVRVAPEAAKRLGVNPASLEDKPQTTFLDISRMEEDFGWKPRYGDLDRIIEHYMGWLRDHPY